MNFKKVSIYATALAVLFAPVLANSQTIEDGKINGEKVISIELHDGHYHLKTENGTEYLVEVDPSAQFPDVEITTYEGSHDDHDHDHDHDDDHDHDHDDEHDHDHDHDNDHDHDHDDDHDHDHDDDHAAESNAETTAETTNEASGMSDSTKTNIVVCGVAAIAVIGGLLGIFMSKKNKK